MADENNAYSFTTAATQQVTLRPGGAGFKMWRGELRRNLAGIA